MLAATSFNYSWQLDKIGKPVDKTEWGMTPQTVNAYYNPLQNEIVFPAAILQPPFFDPQADDALNYGGIGAVIGHEMTHGYDDQGCRFGPTGNFEDWWTEDDARSFKALTGKLVKQFDGYEAAPGQKVNGNLTLGENIADLGGLNIAYDAMQTAQRRQARSEDRRPEPRPALLPGLGDRVAHQVHARATQGPRRVQIRIPRICPRERRANEHAGVRGGVRLQGP